MIATMLGAVVGFALSLVVTRYLRERDAAAPLRREIAALRHRAELAERRWARHVERVFEEIEARKAARAADLAARGMRECVPCRGFGCDDRADEECPDCDGTGEVPL